MVSRHARHAHTLARVLALCCVGTLIVVLVSLTLTLTAHAAAAASFHAEDAGIQTLPPSWFESFHTFLLDPNVVFLLFIVAIIGVYLEIAHPGAILPGVVGGLALLLFLFAVGSLSPNWAGLALMILAFVLLVLDLRVPTHGVLTVGAIISLVFGAFIFFNGENRHGEPQINPLVIYSMAVLIGLISFYLLSVIVRTRGRAVQPSQSIMLGAIAITMTPLLPDGRVKYGGEDWAAILDDPMASVDAGTEVRVVAVEGLRLQVAPIRQAMNGDTLATPLFE